MSDATCNDKDHHNYACDTLVKAQLQMEYCTAKNVQKTIRSNSANSN